MAVALRQVCPIWHSPTPAAWAPSTLSHSPSTPRTPAAWAPPTSSRISSPTMTACPASTSMSAKASWKKDASGLPTTCRQAVAGRAQGGQRAQGGRGRGWREDGGKD